MMQVSYSITPSGMEIIYLRFEVACRLHLRDLCNLIIFLGLHITKSRRQQAHPKRLQLFTV